MTKTTTNTTTMTRNQMAIRNRRNLKWIVLGLIMAAGVFICRDSIDYMIRYVWAPMPHSHNRDILPYEVQEAFANQDGLRTLFTFIPALITTTNLFCLALRIYVNYEKAMSKNPNQHVYTEGTELFFGEEDAA